MATAGTRRDRGRFLPIYTGAVIAYLFVPIVVMILFGFNDTVGRFNFAWKGFTLEWYRNLFDIPELTTALKNSLLVAFLSTLIATAFGTLIALALTRHRFRGRSGLNLFLFLPMATPDVVMGVALLSLFVTLRIPRGFATILIAHVMFLVSYVVVTVKARTSGLDGSLEDAAQDLGAGPMATFWTVTFPLILPGIMAAALLAFALSMDDFIVTNFNAGQTVMFSTWVWGTSRIGVPPQVNVMGTLIFAVGVIYAVTAIVRGRVAER